MNVWLRLSATFHEHPKMLAARKEAGTRADSAELGWYRLLMAAKRYGRWSFASEEHLVHVAGPYYRFVPIYRQVRLLDGLTVHDGDSYNAIKTDAERKAEQRERDKASREGVTSERDMPRDMPRDQSVTLEREKERERTDRERDARARHDEWDDPEGEALTWLARHGCDIRPGNGYHRQLVTAVERHGVNAVVGMFDRLAEAGTRNGDLKGFLFPAIDALDKRTRPDMAEVDAEDRATKVRATNKRNRERTQAMLAEWRETPG